MKGAKCNWVISKLSKSPSESLLAHEKAMIEEHVAHCTNCAKAMETAQALNLLSGDDVAPAPMSPFVEKRVIEAAVIGELPSRSPRDVGMRQLVTAATAVLFGVVAFVWLAREPGGRDAPLITAPAVLPASAEPLVVDAMALEKLVTFKDASPVQLETNDKIWGTAGTTVSIDNAQAHVTSVELLEGKIIAKVQKRHDADVFIVRTSRATVEVVGTVFSVERHLGQPPHVRVMEGTVKVTDLETGRVHLLTSAQALTLGSTPESVSLANNRGFEMMVAESDTANDDAEPTLDDARKPKRRAQVSKMASRAIDEQRLGEAHRHIETLRRTDGSDVPVLLGRLARAYRTQKQFDQAQQTYLQLVRAYSHTTAGQNANVALGQLELNVLGDSSGALSHFSAYLKAAPGGYLAQEAWVGILRVQMTTGQLAAVRDTAAGYLHAFPGGTYEAEMRFSRAKVHRQNNRCDLAKTDYAAIIAKWPDTAKSNRAQQGIDACGGVLPDAARGAIQ